MKNVKIKILILSIIFLAFLIITGKDVKGASVDMPSQVTVTAGQPVTITATVTAGAWNLTLAGGGESTLLVGNTTIVGNQTASASITFTPTQSTKATLTGDITDFYATDNQPEMISKETTIIVNPVQETPQPEQPQTPQTPTQPTTTPQETPKSNNANLGNFGIRPNDFTGFTPSKTEYSTTVPNNVTSVEVYAVKGQSGQTITGTGTKELQEGANTFKVVVTAEDGKTQKTYTLTVNRETAEETPEEENPEEGGTELTEVFGLSSLEIEDVELTPEFSPDIYEYTAKYTGDNTQLNITTTPTEEGTNVEITGNENLVDGENIITILVTDSSGDKTVTYQINIQKEKAEEALLDTNQEELENQNKTRNLILIVGIIVLILIVAIVLIIRHMRNKRWEEEYGGEPYEEDDYNEENPYSNNNYDDNYDQDNDEDGEQSNIEFKKLTQKLVKREKKPEANMDSEEEHEHKDSKQKIKDLYLKQYNDEDDLDDIETRRHGKGKRFK